MKKRLHPVVLCLQPVPDLRRNSTGKQHNGEGEARCSCSFQKKEEEEEARCSYNIIIWSIKPRSSNSIQSWAGRQKHWTADTALGKQTPELTEKRERKTHKENNSNWETRNCKAHNHILELGTLYLRILLEQALEANSLKRIKWT